MRFEFLEAALAKRGGVSKESNAYRLFHGPGEGRGDWKNISVDRYDDEVLVTAKTEPSRFTLSPELARYFRAYRKVHFLIRGKRELKPTALQSLAAPEKIVAEMEMRFRVVLEGVSQTGLFLDHAPLRQWLRKNSSGKSVLNAFCYTGSLSVAAGLGGAKNVVNLDLSRPALEWSKKNWVLNSLPESELKMEKKDFFVFSKTEKLRRSFDVVILDPPSFSRSRSGTFSISKELEKLVSSGLSLLNRGGTLIISTNCAELKPKEFFSRFDAAISKLGVRARLLAKIELPPTFPNDDYLKGGIWRC